MRSCEDKTSTHHIYETKKRDEIPSDLSSRNYHIVKKKLRVSLTNEKLPSEDKIQTECQNMFPAIKAEPNNYVTSCCGFDLFAANYPITKTKEKVALPIRKSVLESKTENEYRVKPKDHHIDECSFVSSATNCSGTNADKRVSLSDDESFPGGEIEERYKNMFTRRRAEPNDYIMD